MSGHVPPSHCDCGACCDSCGHDRGCISFDGPPPPALSVVELRRAADERPNSLLASLMSDVSASDAAYLDIVYGGGRS